MRERRTSGELVLERRRTLRLPLRVDVTCCIAGAYFTGTTENLTVYGLSFETETSVPLDAEVDVVIEPPDDGKPIKAFGRVARLAAREADTRGFAVEFESLDEAARARISALLDEALADLSASS